MSGVGSDADPSLLLSPVAASVGRARHLATATAARWDLADLAGDIELVVSELVTNAVLHARTEIEVSFRRLEAGIRIEVRDGSAAPLRPPVVAPQPDPLSLLDGDADLDELEEMLSFGATTGRGLQLVSSLATSWGYGPWGEGSGAGKVVWADILTGPLPPGSTPSEPPVVAMDHVAEVAPGGGASHPVRLVAVPVRLALESDLHLDTLVREFQVMDLSGPGRPHAAALVAAAGQIMARYGAVRESGQAAVRRALERGDRLLDADLLVPVMAASSLRQLDDLLREVTTFCESGDLLALAPSMELRRFRHWYATEVDRQLRGQPPRACPFSTTSAGDTELDPVDLPEPVREELARMALEFEAAPDADSVAGILLAESVRSLGAVTASLSMLVADTDTVEIAASIGMAQEVSDHWRHSRLTDDVPASEAIRTNRPIVVRTPVERDMRYPAFHGTPVQPDTSFACVPLALPGRPPSGALNIAFARARDFTSGNLQVLTELCGLAAVALERTGSGHRVATHRSRQELLGVIREAMAEGGGVDLEQRLTAVVGALSSHFQGSCSAFLPGPDGRPREAAVASPDPARSALISEMHRRWPNRHADDAVVRCLAGAGTIVFQVVPDDLLVRLACDEEHLAVLRKLGLSSLVVTPVCRGDQVVAALVVTNSAGRYLTDDEVRLVEAVAGASAT